MPSAGEWGKKLKRCFISPRKKVFGGADFNALEDRINTLRSKDPNMMKIYLEGFDGHCFRTYSYWPEMFPNLDLNDPASINTIAATHPDRRSLSKAPSFAMQYFGTWKTLVNNSGFPPDEAKLIESRFQNTYQVYIESVKEAVIEASQVGYVTLAFGLRLDTPALHKTIPYTSTTPSTAEAEARTVGNALGQSYGMLNQRAAIEFMEAVWDSPYRYEVDPVGFIHDANYVLMSRDPDVIQFVNAAMAKAMAWQDDPLIYHPEIGLGGELDLFLDDWSKGVTLPNDAQLSDIQNVLVGP